MTRPIYRYAARFVRAIDGDTYVLDVDLGFKTWLRGLRIRIVGWSCPERFALGGPAATTAARQILESATILIVETEKDAQSLERWLARVWVNDQELGVLLANLGHAVRDVR